MDLIKNLEDILEDSQKEFVNSLRSMSDIYLNSFLNYEEPTSINLVTHLADADGLSSLILLLKGSESIRTLIGNAMITFNSKRVMEIEAGFENDSINDLYTLFGDGLWLFADLPTLIYEDTKILGRTLVLDHHPIKTDTANCKVLNPCQYGIDGSKELSSSIISTYFMFTGLEKLRKMIDVPKSRFKKLERDFDYYAVLGIAGGNADQQTDEGANKPIFDYLRSKNLIDKVDVPFFGYFTKPLEKVLSESTIPFNLKYKVASPSQIRYLFSKYVDGLNGTEVDGIIKEFQKLFCSKSIGKGNSPLIGINEQYLNSLSPTKEERLKKMLQSSLNITLEEMQESFPIVFNDFCDDFKKSEERINSAGRVLKRITDFTKISDVKANKITLSDLSKKQLEELINIYEENLEAFADPSYLPKYLSELRTSQYICTNDNSFLQNSISLDELANSLTSLSKMGCGGDLLNAIDVELGNTTIFSKGAKDLIIGRVKEAISTYHVSVFKGMRVIEKRILESSDDFKKIADGKYFLELDFVDSEIGSMLNLRVMTGVFGGIIASNRYLPGNYGLIFTSCKLPNGDYKVSGRINPSLGQKVDIGYFMASLRNLGLGKGGGHKEAAACIVPKNKLDFFFECVRKFDFEDAYRKTQDISSAIYDNYSTEEINRNRPGGVVSVEEVINDN